MIELTSRQINIVIEAQQQMIDFPKKAVVNSESSFVHQLISVSDPELASAYWSWVCALNNPDKLEVFNDPTIRANQLVLEELGGSYYMPSWGYAGT